MKYIYIAGPIGKDEHQAKMEAAIDVAEKLRRALLYPFVPHLMIPWGAIHEHHYECWMRLDFAWIKRCDALFRMEGVSPGADREVAFAKNIGLPVFYIVEHAIEWAQTSV